MKSLTTLACLSGALSLAVTVGTASADDDELFEENFTLIADSAPCPGGGGLSISWEDEDDNVKTVRFCFGGGGSALDDIIGDDLIDTCSLLANFCPGSNPGPNPDDDAGDEAEEEEEQTQCSSADDVFVPTPGAGAEPCSKATDTCLANAKAGSDWCKGIQVVRASDYCSSGILPDGSQISEPIACEAVPTWDRTSSYSIECEDDVDQQDSNKFHTCLKRLRSFWDDIDFAGVGLSCDKTFTTDAKICLSKADEQCRPQCVDAGLNKSKTTSMSLATPDLRSINRATAAASGLLRSGAPEGAVLMNVIAEVLVADESEQQAMSVLQLSTLLYPLHGRSWSRLAEMYDGQGLGREAEYARRVAGGTSDNRPPVN